MVGSQNSQHITGGEIVKLHHEWHMCVHNSGEVITNDDLMGIIIVGPNHGLKRMAERKLARGIWDCVFIFPPGSESDPNTPMLHPGNPYWVGEVGDGGYISWINLDE